MKEFILKEIINSNMSKELTDVGFDRSYAACAQSKYLYHNIKIYELTVAQANILKQTALSYGADCATHRETITARVEKSDCILTGSTSHIKKIAQSLTHQPFGLKFLAQKLVKFVEHSDAINTLPPRPKIVGILNITENSFSDGGMYFDTPKACEHLLELISDGADIIDIGAESTKPFSSPVSAQTQLEKILPVLDFAKQQNITTPISIDTRSAQVAEKCIQSGATIINDVSGLTYDKNMANVIAKHDVDVIIQHSQGAPEDMQIAPHYDNLIDEIYLNLKSRLDFAQSQGIQREKIIVDPGIGFGKTRENNFEIIKRVGEFHGLGCPVMLGISRKSLLNMPECDNFTKDVYTLALNALATSRKVQYLRVHNVKLHKALLNFDL